MRKLWFKVHKEPARCHRAQKGGSGFDPVPDSQACALCPPHLELRVEVGQIILHVWIPESAPPPPHKLLDPVRGGQDLGVKLLRHSNTQAQNLQTAAEPPAGSSGPDSPFLSLASCH